MGRTPTGTGSPRVVNLASESGAWEACHTGPSAPHLGRHQGLKRGGSEDVVEISGLGNVDRLPADVSSSRPGVFDSQVHAQNHLGQRRVVAGSPNSKRKNSIARTRRGTGRLLPPSRRRGVSFGDGPRGAVLCWTHSTVSTLSRMVASRECLDSRGIEWIRNRNSKLVVFRMGARAGMVW